MTFVRYEPWGAATRTAALLPRVNVREEVDRYVVETDLPGIAPADIEVTTEQDVLTIKAERRAERRDSAAAGVERFERTGGTFLRRFTLPDDADANSIAARSAHGVLELTIAKQPKLQPKRIAVEAA